jgi:hypothetical protein
MAHPRRSLLPALFCPMKFTTKLETTVHECDKTGRTFLRFVPVITPLQCASGQLKTACFEAWIDEPETIAKQRAAALKSAAEALAYLFS